MVDAIVAGERYVIISFSLIETSYFLSAVDSYFL